MSPRTYLTLSAVALCLILSSCSKSDSKPTTITTTTTAPGTLNINSYIPFTSAQSELIVSEPAGNILLDTVVTSGTAPIVAALRTNDTLVDATVIFQFVHTITEIETFKSVNLARLSSLITNGYSLGYKSPALTQAQLVYYNIPPQVDLSSITGNLCIGYYPAYAGSGYVQTNPYYHTVNITYQSDTTQYSYILFPQVGLYNLHKQQNALDSVDCSYLDTAVMLTFNRPVPFTTSPGYSSLYGILDTTDLSKAISFTNFLMPSTKAGVDFEYPPIPVQKYEMSYYATYSNNDQLNYYAYTKTLPQTLPLPQESDFSISNAQTDNFSVTFPNAKPTMYEIALVGDTTLYYTTYVSPDSTATIHPLTFLTNLKSKLLQNATLSKLQLQEFQLWDFNGLSYLNYFSYITNPSAIQAHHPTSVASLTRGYN